MHLNILQEVEAEIGWGRKCERKADDSNFAHVRVSKM